MDLRDRIRPLAVAGLPLGLALSTPVFVAAFLGYLALSRPRRRWRDRFPALLFVASAVLATGVSARTAVAAGDLLALVLTVAAYGLWVGRVARSDVRAFSLGLATTTLLLGGVAVAEVFVLGKPRAEAFQYHSNVLGYLAALALLVQLVALQRARSRWERLLLAAGLVGSLLALLLSGGRSAVFGAAAGAIAVSLLAARGGRFSWKLPGAIAGSVLALALAVAVAASLLPRGATNRIQNSSFELGAVAWTFGSGAESSVAAQRHGRASVRIATDGTDDRVVVRTDQDLPVNGGGDYAVSAYGYSEAAAASLVLVVDAFDEQGGFVARLVGDDWRFVNPGPIPTESLWRIAGTGRWQRFEAQLPPLPPAARRLQIAFAQGDATPIEALYLDAWQLEAGRSATEYAPGAPPSLEVLLGPTLQRASRLFTDDDSLAGRATIWRVALQLVAQRPFLGYGADGWNRYATALAPAAFIETIGHAHSLYLELALRGGTLLLTSFLGWFVLLALGFLRRPQAPGSAAVLAVAILVVSLAIGVFDSFLANNHVLAYALFAIGLAHAEAGGRDRLESDQERAAAL